MMTRCNNCSSMVFYPNPADRPRLCHCCKLRNEHGPTNKPAKPPKRRKTRKAK